MNDGQPQSTHREWRTHMAHPATLIALAGAGVVMGIAGPFGTDEHLTLVARIVYWVVTVTLTYGAGAWCDAALARLLGRYAGWLRLALTATATRLCIAAIILGLNLVTFGYLPNNPVAFVLTTFVVGALVTVVLALVRSQVPTPDAIATPRATPPRILSRLPLERRGALVALSVEDHYVRVQTTRGADMVLMRLSDAMAEVGDTPGAQVHRSHWVAFDQVTGAARRGDGARLTLATGAEIPVSRANVARIREAGLLP